MRAGHERITKAQFYALGGFSNSKLYRKQRGNSWAYFRIHN